MISGECLIKVRFRRRDEIPSSRINNQLTRLQFGIDLSLLIFLLASRVIETLQILIEWQDSLNGARESWRAG